MPGTYVIAVVWMGDEKDGGEWEEGREEGGKEGGEIKEGERMGEGKKTSPCEYCAGFQILPYVFAHPNSLSSFLKPHSLLYNMPSNLSDKPIVVNELVDYNEKCNASANFKQRYIDK